MLSTETFLAIYYLGYGFVIFLGWACLNDTTDGPAGPARRTRLHRLVRGLALLGLLHPGFAIAGRDIAAELSRAEGPYDARAAATARTATWALGVALVVAALVVASQLGPLAETPVLRQVRTGLPFG